MDVLELLEIESAVSLPKRYSEMSVEEMEERVKEIKSHFGKRLFIPGHHYQKDEVIQFADARGDSLKLAQICAEMHEAEFIAFVSSFYGRNCRYVNETTSKGNFTRSSCRLFNGRHG